jgi:DNA-binding CsgD family transcriptional regulator
MASADAHSVSRFPDPRAPHTATGSELKQLLEAERSGQPFLCLRAQSGDLIVRMLPTELDRVTVGRRESADIAIEWDLEVSGLHAELERLAGEWTVLDDGLSSNGTFVNEQPVGGRRRLRGGDRIRVGRTVIVYTAGGLEGALPETAAAGGRSAITLTEAQHRVAAVLCNPCLTGSQFAAPASNREIADQLFLSVDAVKMHLRALFSKLELDDVPQNQKRAQLARLLIESGVVKP